MQSRQALSGGEAAAEEWVPGKEVAAAADAAADASEVGRIRSVASFLILEQNLVKETGDRHGVSSLRVHQSFEQEAFTGRA